MKCINSYEQQKIVQLEKQLDWLADHAGILNCPPQKWEYKCPIKDCTIQKSRECWREAARKATEGE